MTTLSVSALAMSSPPTNLGIFRLRRAAGMSARDALKGAEYAPVDLATVNGFNRGDWVKDGTGLEGRIQSFQAATATTPTIAYVVCAGIAHAVPVNQLTPALCPPCGRDR
jgi:hypothetical protein